MSTPMYPTTKPKGNFWLAAVIMFIGSFVLGFIPFLGPFIVGIIGGKVAGSARRGVLAALVPAIIGALFVVAGSLIFHPLGAIFGIFAGIGLVLIAIFHGLALLLGAIIGGIL